ncbi:MAG: transposase [Deltaproteobacteria bacterium]|nr:transposase [Deltaproteobacteria bacterium]
MRYRRSKAKGASFFFTVVTHGRKKTLCRKENVLLIKEAFKRVIAERPFTIDAFVLLPDHIHCIWTLPENDNDFSTRWRLFKSFFTKGCRDEFKSAQTDSMLKKGEQAIWQRRFWEHTIRDEDDFIRHADYIHYNPVKHGLAESPKDWPHTSFHRYVDMGVYDREWGSGREMAFDECVGRE